jgi:hypothetical protein
MTNGPIKQHLLDRKIPLTSPYYADRDPKDIAELRLLGINIIGAVKGNVVASISKVLDATHTFDKDGKFVDTTLFITSSSYNVIRDFDNYQWEVFNGKPINVPVEGNDHSPDALRYGYLTPLSGPQSGGSANAW